MWLIWLIFFLLTWEQPLARSLTNAISTGSLTLISIFYRPLAYFSARWTLWYYIYDTFDLITRRRSKVYQDLFLYHHIMALAYLWESLHYGTPKFVWWSTILGVLFEFTTIFMNWMKMMRQPQLYQGWYPKISTKYINIGFVSSFVLCRIVIALPLSLWIFPLAPPICQISIIVTNVLNLWWTYRIYGHVKRLLINKCKE